MSVTLLTEEAAPTTGRQKQRSTEHPSDQSQVSTYHVLSCTLTGIEGHVQGMCVSSCETDTLCRFSIMCISVFLWNICELILSVANKTAEQVLSKL